VTINFERLFRLRAAVGRFGEMDGAGWWNTQGVLGMRGAAVYKRGLPQTHMLARVRTVSAVAAERSSVIYPATGAATLWSLPPALERSLAFQERSWATDPLNDWTTFDDVLASPPKDLAHWLTELDLVDPDSESKVSALKLDPGGEGLAVPGPISDAAIELLALGHSRGRAKHLIVPFIRNGLGSASG